MDDLPIQTVRESPHHGYRGEARPSTAGTFVPAGVTIAVSREAGARGGTIGRRVGRLLGRQVYDQELLEHLLQDPNMQQGFTEGLSEAASAWVEQQFADLFSSNVEMPTPIATIVRLTLALAAQGNVVLIGRGAGFLLPRATTLHVRLIAPLEDRISYMSQWLRLTTEEARHRVELRDSRRADFLTTHLRRHPGETYGYDLILNTSSFGEELTTDLIVAAVRAKESLIGRRNEEGME